MLRRMNFVSRFAFRFQAHSIQSSFKHSILKLSTSSQLAAKYGKLINDQLTNSFYLPIGENSNEMAAVTYDKHKGLLNLLHTKVPDSLQGEGVGHDLAKEVFEYCSTRNLKVLLTCEFMQKFYKENPQYKDLVVVREKMNI